MEADIEATYDLCDSAVQWYFNNHTDESIDDYDANDDDDRTFLDLELDLEFGLDLLAHYAKKTHIE